MESTPVGECSDMMYGAAWMQSAIASHQAQDNNDLDPYHELSAYIWSPLEPHESLPDLKVLTWWKDHAVVYPTLVKIAQDYLAICGSSSALEQQFSSAQHIGTDFCNHLSPTMFEAIQLLKGGYKAGIISANLEVSALANELECTIAKIADMVSTPVE
jgi:hypothetical protein